MWSTAEPVVREWIERNLGPVGRIEEAGRGALSLAGIFGTLPELVSRANTVADRLETATRNGFLLDPRSAAAIGRAEAHARRWTHAALWVIAGLLAYIAVTL
jgi:ubiquinone biosynthesis protein